MKSITLLASLAAASVICVAAGCSSKSDDNNGAAGNTSGGSTGAAGENTGEAGDGTGATTGEGGDKGTAGTGGTGGGVTACGTGVLFQGNPTYERASDYDTDAKPKPAGQGLLDDPPIRDEAMAVIGSTVYWETEQEIWSADTSLKTPVLKRIAGKEVDSGGFINAGVACADTTFLVVRDMVATAEGKLALVDAVAGAVVEITDPGTANCKSVYVAGTHEKTDNPGPDFPLNSGDMDGPGSSALFGGDHEGKGMIEHIAADPSGNYYVFDNGTGKFRMIATDEDRTVSTIGQGSADDAVFGMAVVNGKLYAVGTDSENDFMLEIDPKAYNAAKPKDNVKEIFRANDHFPEVQDSQAVPASLVADGDALIVSGLKQYIWRIATDGTVLATLAGTGARLDFDADFDPTKPHPASDWELVTDTGGGHGGPWLALGGGKLYWGGGVGINKYTVQFSCP